MGFEYKFRFDNLDWERFNTDVNDRTVDVMLRNAPGFQGGDGMVYEYLPDDANEATWKRSVLVQPDGLLLCIYQRNEDSFDLQLMNYLIYEILSICCRVEIEDG